MRRLLFALLALPLAYSAAPRASNDLPQSLSVQQHDGTYEVSASFDVPRPIAIVRAVLTDYEHIPKFLPQVERSVVLERTESGVLVDQQAVTQLLMFSKRMHLVLDIREAADVLTFTDTCGQSFVRYEGSWRLRDDGGRTSVRYRLLAEPRFDAPDWLVARLMKRDAGRTIERIQSEINRR